MAVRRARFKPTANLSIKRPAATNNRPAILRAPQVKAEKEDVPNEPSTSIKKEPLVLPKQEGAAKLITPAAAANPPPPQFLPPRPSPSPSPVLSPAPPPPSRSPMPHQQHPARSPAYIAARSPAHSLAHGMDDALFKSPIMSPSYPPLSRTPNPFAMKIMSPNPHQPPSPFADSPGSPNKARHRIRPIPVFSNQRRNSSQISEDDEIRIPHQRVRHISTSSTTSLTKFVPQQVGRIRTESTCSAYSDVSVFKPRRAGRSDEYMRLCEARRELLKKCNGDAPDKSQLRMYDMIYYNPKTNPMKRPVDETGSEIGGGSGGKERRLSLTSTRSLEDLKQEPKEKKEPEVPSNESAMPVPQLKLGPNGEMILDEKSLTIEMTGEKEARERIANADIVYDDLNSSNGFYKRHARTRDWPPEETIRFYRCLQVIGTDFSLMNSLFPNRSRRDLKLKFKKEEKTNGFLINKALIEHTSFDIESLEETFRKEDEKRAEEMRELQKAKEKAKEEKALLAKKLKQRGVRCSRSEKAVDENSTLDLEKMPTKVIRQHAPRRVKRPATAKAAEIEDSFSVPASPFSIPPPSPCKTPNWPPSPRPQAGRKTPQRQPTPTNELYYYDMDLNRNTRGERKVSESRAGAPIEIFPPKSVEMVQDYSDGEEKKPLRAIIVKQEKVDREEKERKISTAAEDGELDYEEEQEEEEEYDVDEEGEEENLVDGLDLSNLVVLEAFDEHGKKTFKVHFMDKETDEMSEEPLDLPQEVIDYIVEAHQKTQKQTPVSE